MIPLRFVYLFILEAILYELHETSYGCKILVGLVIVLKVDIRFIRVRVRVRVAR